MLQIFLLSGIAIENDVFNVTTPRNQELFDLLSFQLCDVISKRGVVSRATPTQLQQGRGLLLLIHDQRWIIKVVARILICRWLLLRDVREA